MYAREINLIVISISGDVIVGWRRNGCLFMTRLGRRRVYQLATTVILIDDLIGAVRWRDAHKNHRRNKTLQFGLFDKKFNVCATGATS